MSLELWWCQMEDSFRRRQLAVCVPRLSWMNLVCSEVVMSSSLKTGLSKSWLWYKSNLTLYLKPIAFLYHTIWFSFLCSFFLKLNFEITVSFIVIWGTVKFSRHPRAPVPFTEFLLTVALENQMVISLQKGWGPVQKRVWVLLLLLSVGGYRASPKGESPWHQGWFVVMGSGPPDPHTWPVGPPWCRVWGT